MKFLDQTKIYIASGAGVQLNTDRVIVPAINHRGQFALTAQGFDLLADHFTLISF
jgi:hypothetical protein